MIEEHTFYDEDLTLREAMDDKVSLDCALTDIDQMQYVELDRNDIVALAKHFEIKSSEL